MQKSSLDDMENIPNPLGAETTRKSITEAVGAEEVAMNHYELAPGESFSAGLHTHNDLEELFYIISGTATFQVGKDRTEVPVGAGEAIRFASGEFQTGQNRSEEPVVGLAISAPGRRHDWSEIDSLQYCQVCEAETLWTCGKIGTGDGEAKSVEITVTCQECGTTISSTDID